MIIKISIWIYPFDEYNYLLNGYERICYNNWNIFVLLLFSNRYSNNQIMLTVIFSFSSPVFENFDSFDHLSLVATYFSFITFEFIYAAWPLISNQWILWFSPSWRRPISWINHASTLNRTSLSRGRVENLIDLCARNNFLSIVDCINRYFFIFKYFSCIYIDLDLSNITTWSDNKESQYVISFLITNYYKELKRDKNKHRDKIKFIKILFLQGERKLFFDKRK